MKNFICEMFYKQRTEFERSYASRGKEYPLPEDVSLQSDIFYDKKHLPAHRLDVSRYCQCPWRRAFNGKQGI